MASKRVQHCAHFSDNELVLFLLLHAFKDVSEIRVGFYEILFNNQFDLIYSIYFDGLSFKPILRNITLTNLSNEHDEAVEKQVAHKEVRNNLKYLVFILSCILPLS